MKDHTFISNRGKLISARHAAQGYLAAVLVALMGVGGSLALCQAQPSDNDQPGAQVLTRGPVHEAFAGVVTFNPEPGVVISKAPPEVIEELPPEERPEGDNVSWIPGYWGWDDERSDFLWVSGTWRALPPGRAWMAGYWGQTSRGHQWISGYWADASVRETTYLPPPPATVEVGPNIAAPSVDYGWSPGCWVWYQGRYAWQPGYWAQGRADWDWMPAHYIWTPRGHVFVGGYWDYPIQRRGIVFAPVYFESSYYSRRGYVYSPSIVISLGVFTDHLFLRPSYGHYYFGDYYAPSYHQGGFYASFSFQSGRHGYDPFYSRHRWTHRQDRDWERRTETSYQYRRDHEAARPPRTYAAQSSISVSISATERSQMLVAAPIAQVAKRTDGGMRFQSVARTERQQLSVRGQEVQKSREQRRTLEATAVDTTPRRSGEAFQPAKVEMPRSPIVAKPANKSGRDQTPPQAQQAPKPDLNRQPKSEPAARPQNDGQNKPQVEPRRSEPQRKSAPGRDEAAPREKQAQPQAQPKPERRPEQSEKPTQREAPKNDRKLEAPAPARSEQPAKDAAVTPRQDSQRNPPGLEKKTPTVPEPTAQDRAVKTREENQRNANEQEPKAVRRSEPSVKDAARNPSEDPQRKVRGVEGNQATEPTPRIQDRAVKPRQESPRNAAGLEPKSSGGSVQPVRKNPAPTEKGATRLMKNDRRKEGKGKP